MCCRRWLVAASVVLASCGGGGGSSAGSGAVPDGPRQPLASVVRNDDPTAARLSVGPADYLPVDGGGEWVYQRQDDAGRPLGTTRVTARVSGLQITVSEADDQQAADSTTYRRESRGWVLPEPGLAGLPAGANRIIGDLLPYASPFHAIGSVRVQFRAGDYGQDLDGDGVNESFELELRQTMVGFETVAGPTGLLETLHLRDELRFTVIPSRRDAPSASATVRSDNWLGLGIGSVREQRSSTVPAGQATPAPYTLALASVRIGGHDPLDRGVLNPVLTLDLPNRDLVFDAARGRYYASVPGAVVGQGNRIASIDAATGAVTLSGAVGSEPGALAIAADGASLYVALDGSGELLRLALPGMTELARVRLPSVPFFGQMTAESLAASPVQGGTLAVALAYTGSSPQHAGVALVRDMVLAPRRTQSHTGSNLITFAASGQQLFGFNNETTEFGLRRIDVLADGLAEGTVVGAAASGFYLKSLQRDGDRLVLGSRVFGAEPLAPRGQVAGAFECVPLQRSRLACMTGSFDAALSLLVADAQSFVIAASLHGAPDNQGWRRVLVAGPPGQLAVRDRISHPAAREAARVLILRHAALD